jgi:hypothetical protein
MTNIRITTTENTNSEITNAKIAKAKVTAKIDWTSIMRATVFVLGLAVTLATALAQGATPSGAPSPTQAAPQPASRDPDCDRCGRREARCELRCGRCDRSEGERDYRRHEGRRGECGHDEGQRGRSDRYERHRDYSDRHDHDERGCQDGDRHGSRREDESAKRGDYSAPNPKATGSPKISEFVLYAERSVRMGECDTAFGGDIGVRSTAEQGFGIQLKIGAGSVVQRSQSVLSPSVLLGRNVRIGVVETNSIEDNGVPLGPLVTFPAAAMPALPLAPASGGGGANVTVGADEVVALLHFPETTDP